MYGTKLISHVKRSGHRRGEKNTKKKNKTKLRKMQKRKKENTDR